MNMFKVFEVIKKKYHKTLGILKQKQVLVNCETVRFCVIKN